MGCIHDGLYNIYIRMTSTDTARETNIDHDVYFSSDIIININLILPLNINTILFVVYYPHFPELCSDNFRCFHCRSLAGKKELTQQECYTFLASAVKFLRNKSLLRQRSALELMKEK